MTRCVRPKHSMVSKHVRKPSHHSVLCMHACLSVCLSVWLGLSGRQFEDAHDLLRITILLQFQRICECTQVQYHYCNRNDRHHSLTHDSIVLNRYANRARNIKNKPIVNRDPTVVVIEQLKQLLGAMSVELLDARRARSYVESGDAMIPLDTLETWAMTHYSTSSSTSSSSSKSMSSKLPHKAVKESQQRLSITSEVMPSLYSDVNDALKSQVRESDLEVLRLTNALRLAKQQVVEANDSLILALSERDFYRMKWSDACPDEAKALDEGEAVAVPPDKGIGYRGGSDADVVDSSTTATTTAATSTTALQEKQHVMKCVSGHLREIESLKKDLAVERAKNAATAAATMSCYPSGLTTDSSEEAMFDADFTNSISTLLTQTREQLKLESERLKSELGGVEREMMMIPPSSDATPPLLITPSAELEDGNKDDAYMKRQDLLSSEVRELGKSIQLKEQLMTQLLRSKEQYGAMKAYYENKLASLSVVMAEKQRERNMLLIELQDVSTGEKSDALVQREEAKEKHLRDELKRKDEELRSMKVKQEELQRLAQQQSSYSQQLHKLEHEISSMKKQRVDLSRTLQVEKRSHITQLAEKAKEIDRLRKELERSAGELKRMEKGRDLAESRAKDAVRDGAMLRRKTNEFLRTSTGSTATVPSTLAAYRTMDRMSRLGGALSGSSKRIFTEEELKTKKWIDRRIEDIARREAAADALKAQYEHQLELLTRKESLQQAKDNALKHNKQGLNNVEDRVPSEFDALADVNMILSAEERQKLIEIEEQLSDIDRVLNVKSLQMNDIAEQLVDSGDAAASSDKTMEMLKRTAAGSLPAAHELIRLLFDMLVQSSRSCRVRADEASSYRESIGVLKLEVQQLQLQLTSATHRHDVELMTTSSEYEQKMQDLFQQFSSILHKERDEMMAGADLSDPHSPSDPQSTTQIALLMEETAFLRSQLHRDSSELAAHKSKARELENAKNRLHAEIRDKADQLRFLEEDRSLFKSLTDDLRAGLLSLGKQGRAIVDSIRDRHVRVNGKRGAFSEFGGAAMNDVDDDGNDGDEDSERILNEFSLLAEEIFRTGTIPSSAAPPSLLLLPAVNLPSSDAAAAAAVSPKNFSGTTASTSYSSNNNNSSSSSNNSSSSSNNNSSSSSKSIYDRLTNPSNYTGYMKNVFENDLELKRKKIQLQRGSYDKYKPINSSGGGGGTHRDGSSSKRNHVSDPLLLPPPISMMMMMSIGSSDAESNENTSPVVLSSDSSSSSSGTEVGSSPIKLHLRNGSPSQAQYSSSSSNSSSSSSSSSVKKSSMMASSAASLLPPRPPPPTPSTNSSSQSTTSPSVPC